MIQIERNQLVIEWVREPEEQFSTSADHSQIRQSIALSENELSNRASLSQVRENRKLEPLPEKDSSFSQTIQTSQTNQTNQTRDGAVDRIEVERSAPKVVRQESQAQEPTTTNKASQSLTPLAELRGWLKPLSQNQPPRRDENFPIPADLKNKLAELKIPLDRRVQKLIAAHALSQAYGALAHIENTWETINNPRSIFIFQLPRQPIEPLGTRGSVRTAREFGYTLDHLKKMYPQSWQEAAAYFGLSVPTSGACQIVQPAAVPERIAMGVG